MPNDTRHGKRRPGQVVVTFAMPEGLKREIGKLSSDDGVTPSEWMRMKLRDTVRRHYAATKR